MSVIDAIGSIDISGNSGNTFSDDTTITVGSGSNRALLVMISWSGASAPTGVSITWGGVALTLIGSTSITSSAVTVALYGLVNPASGAQTLAGSWTGTTTSYSVFAVSFTGVNQSSVAAAFPNGVTTSGAASATGSATVTSATGDLAVGFYSNDGSHGIGSVNDTELYIDNDLFNICVGANYAAGSSSVALTATMNGTVNWVSAGVSVASASTSTAWAGSAHLSVGSSAKISSIGRQAMHAVLGPRMVSKAGSTALSNMLALLNAGNQVAADTSVVLWSLTRFIGSAKGANTATAPAHQAGDLMLVAAQRASTSPPTPPAGYSTIATKTQGSLSLVLAYKIATASDDATGTFANATETVLHIYRPNPGNKISIGDVEINAGTTSPISYPALDLQPDSPPAKQEYLFGADGIYLTGWDGYYLLGGETIETLAISAAASIGSSMAANLTLVIPTLTVPVVSNIRTVSSQNVLFNVASGGSTQSNNLNVSGTSAYPSSTISVYLGGVLQGTATADSSGNWSYALGILADANYSLTATVTSGGKTSSASSAYTFTVAPGLTSLPVSIGGNIYDSTNLTWSGIAFQTQSDTAKSNPKSCIVISTHELDFTLLPTDDWTEASGPNRTEIFQTATHADGSTFNISYEAMLDASSPINDAAGGGKWFVWGQVHDSGNSSPPYSNNLGGDSTKNDSAHGDKLYIEYNSTFITGYTSPANFSRGVWHTFDIILKPNSSGAIAKVWLDGVQVINATTLHGTSPYYWKMGVYRGGTLDQTQIIRYRNLLIKMT